MVEVLAERAFAHALLEVLVRGRDHAHVGLDLLMAADAVEGAVGEHAQQARLQLGRHVADLVEEERAAFGLLEAAAALLLRAGEGAALVAEELDSSRSLGIAAVLIAMNGCWRAHCGGAARARQAPFRFPIRR